MNPNALGFLVRPYSPDRHTDFPSILPDFISSGSILSRYPKVSKQLVAAKKDASIWVKKQALIK